MLMEDQVAYLLSLGLSAIALHDEQSEERLKEVEKWAFAFLFASPEKMLSVERWRKLLLTEHYRKFLVAITVDEAHCISQWGLPGSSSKRTAVPFVRVIGHWSTDVLFGNVLLSSSISIDVTDAPKSSKATRFVACSWESLIWFEGGVGTGNGTAEHFFDWTIFWIELFTSWRLFKSALRFFSAQRQFLQMYVELISTLHSKDSSSSRNLKELPLRPSTRFLSVFFTMSTPQRTHELIVKISHHVIVANESERFCTEGSDCKARENESQSNLAISVM